MNAERKPKLLEILLISLPILIAVIQLYLSNASDLSTWKGGGFGMYTDPHPRVSRFVWMEGVGRDSVVAIRLYPLDERLKSRFVRPTGIKNAIEKLRFVTRESRYFPAKANLNSIRASWSEFIEEYGEDPTIAALFPRSGLRLKVVEVSLSPDFHSLESRLISDREL